MLNHRKAIAALTCLAALGGSGVALAADGPTQITVQTAPTLAAGQTAPFDAAGVRAIRRGKAIPRGYVLIGQQVEIKRGQRNAGAGLFFRCPDRKRLQTFGVIGDAGFTATRDYVGHRQTQVLSFAPPTRQQSTGTVYAVCR
ncbi:MAG: hypothetical protein QOC64_1369 [Solirubrobacteraceae bacterium]|nr:hypothetical protein [Solirubrobacteraceae bacterium]